MCVGAVLDQRLIRCSNSAPTLYQCMRYRVHRNLIYLYRASLYSLLLCKAKMQYLLTCKVSRYCLLALRVNIGYMTARTSSCPTFTRHNSVSRAPHAGRERLCHFIDKAARDKKGKGSCINCASN